MAAQFVDSIPRSLFIYLYHRTSPAPVTPELLQLLNSVFQIPPHRSNNIHSWTGSL
jgi:hypothetical protein